MYNLKKIYWFSSNFKLLETINKLDGFPKRWKVFYQTNKNILNYIITVEDIFSPKGVYKGGIGEQPLPENLWCLVGYQAQTGADVMFQVVGYKMIIWLKFLFSSYCNLIL